MNACHYENKNALVYSYQTVMYQCWHGNPDERPTFSQLQTKISAVLSSMADYLEFSEIVPCDEIDEVCKHIIPSNRFAQMADLKGKLGGCMACEVQPSVLLQLIRVP